MNNTYAKIMPGSTEIVFFEKENLELEDMQQVVGGLIESLYINMGFSKMRIDMFINEEGKLIQGMKPTAVMIGVDDSIVDVILGPILFTSTDKEGATIPLSEEQILYIKQHLVGDTLLVKFRGHDEPISLQALRLD
jgi:hypothetical protein